MSDERSHATRRVRGFSLVGLGLVLLAAVAVLSGGQPMVAQTGSGPSRATVLDVKGFGARGDGRTDDRPAFEKALEEVEKRGGGTLIIPPGVYVIVATEGRPYLSLRARTEVSGTRGATRIVLKSDAPDGYRELFRVNGDDVTLDGVDLARGGAVGTSVLVKIFPSERFLMRNVNLDGQREKFSGTVQGTEIAAVKDGRYEDVRYEGCSITGVDYGLFMTNESTATLRGFVASRCRFRRNAADDLQFNAPNGAMSDVTVTDCRFEENRSTNPANGAGFGFGLAHVERASLRDCRFENYPCEAVHIEDRTRDVTISGCSFRNCGTEGFAVINVINESHQITVSGNHFDSSEGKKSFPCVKVASGGPKLGYPDDIIVTGNTFRLGGSSNGVEAFSTPRVLVANNSFEGSGVFVRGKYSGGRNYAINLTNTRWGVIQGNIFKGLWSVTEESKSFPPLKSAVVSGNLVIDCGRDLFAPGGAARDSFGNVQDGSAR